MHILVVDDDEMVCQSLKLLLECDHHETEFAFEATEALTKFQKTPFDLVFTDYFMPGMRGDELARVLKQKEANQKVVLVSAFPPPVKPQGIDAVVLKPFSLDEIRNVLAATV